MNRPLDARRRCGPATEPSPEPTAPKGMLSIQFGANLLHLKEVSILVTGLAAAGKTAIFESLKIGDITRGFGSEETIQYGYVTFTILDADAQIHQCGYPHGIIFVVDSGDRDRVAEAKHALHRLLNEEELKDAVLLVLANKHDLPNAMHPAEITEKLELYFLRQRYWHILRTCAISGEGLSEGLDWLSYNIGNKGSITKLTENISFTFAEMFQRLLGEEKILILMVGLTASGKTTLFYKLKDSIDSFFDEAWFPESKRCDIGCRQ